MGAGVVLVRLAGRHQRQLKLDAIAKAKLDAAARTFRAKGDAGL